MTQLHVDLLVRLQEHANWNGQDYVVEWEDEKQAPNLIHPLVDGKVICRVSHTQGIPNVRYECFVHRTIFLDIGATDEEKYEVHAPKVGAQEDVENDQSLECTAQHVHKPIHVGEDAERFHHAEWEHQEKESIYILKKLGVPSNQVDVSLRLF